MTRVKGGNRRLEKRKRVLNQTEGFFLSRKNVHMIATQALIKAWANAFRGRKEKKREFRRLWITRINAAARQHGLSYSRFISGLKNADIHVNRKVLADIAMNDMNMFESLCVKAKEGLTT